VSQVAVVHDPAEDHRYLGTRAVGEASWDLKVTAGLLTPMGGLYGGTGIAVAAAAAESATGRALRWITCQFADTATEGEHVRVDVEIDKHGHRTSQASVRGAVGERVVFRAIAALGEPRADVPAAAWVAMPEVPGPTECRPLETPFPTEGTCIERSERRLARGPHFEDFLSDEPRPPGFQMCFWSRMVGHESGSPAMLAWLADIVPMSVAAGLGAAVRGTSLDNTLRMVESARPDWVLVDVRPTAASDGYAHGDVHLWAPDGRLLATGSQTAVLRQWAR
jgi:acyl-CoA thioesterase II